MVRFLGCFVVSMVVASVGCQRSPNGVDPFLGRTTIPPPGTGMPSDQYYSGGNPVYPAPATTPPTVQFPPAGGQNPALPSTGTPSLQQPPGGMNPPPASYYNGSSYEAPSNAGQSLTEVAGDAPPRLRPVPQFDTTPLGSTSASESTVGNSVVVIDGPQANPVVHVSHNEYQGRPLELASNVRVPAPQLTRSAGSQVQATAAPTLATGPVTATSSTLTGPVIRRATTDLADLPPVHSSALASAQSGGSNSQFNSSARPTSQPQTLGTSSAAVHAEARGDVSLAHYEQPAAAPAGGEFAHAEDYSWLKGRLEYSAARKEWKLRYLRIDAAETDQYGGSAVLDSGNLLQGFSAGDYITVQGRVAGAAGDAGSFAPVYNVTRVERQ